MPGARHPDKVLISLWVYRDLHELIKAAHTRRGISRTRLVLDALADHLGVTLDEEGNLIASTPESVPERLDVQASKNRKPTSGKRTPRKPASEAPSGRQAGKPSKTGKPGGKSTDRPKAG